MTKTHHFSKNLVIQGVTELVVQSKKGMIPDIKMNRKYIMKLFSYEASFSRRSISCVWTSAYAFD